MVICVVTLSFATIYQKNGSTSCEVKRSPLYLSTHYFFQYIMAPQSEQQKNPMSKWIALIIIVVILGGLIAFIMWRRSALNEVSEVYPEKTEQSVPASGSIPAPTGTVPTANPDVTSPPTTQKSVYKDGTYTATGHYASPGGADSIDVTLTLKDNVVTDVQVIPKGQSPASKRWEENFAGGIKEAIVGQKIDSIQLDSVSGSSLTPIGFMDALAQIKTQAKI